MDFLDLLLRTAMVVAFQLFPTLVAVLVVLASALFTFVTTYLTAPQTDWRMNLVKGATSSIQLAAALLSVSVVGLGYTDMPSYGLPVILGLLILVGIGGAFLMTLRLRYHTLVSMIPADTEAQKKLLMELEEEQEASPAIANVRTWLKKCRLPVDVEIMVRSLVTNKTLSFQVKAGVGCAVFEAGIERYPKSAPLLMTYISFLTYVAMEEVQTPRMRKLTSKLRRVHPSLELRFSLFLLYKRLEHLDLAASSGDDSVNAVDAVRYKSQFRIARHHHRRALVCALKFWRALLKGQKNANILSVLSENVQIHQTEADNNYQQLTQAFPNSIPLLRAYAAFQMEVVSDEAKSKEMVDYADELEDRRSKRIQRSASLAGSVASDGMASTVGPGNLANVFGDVQGRDRMEDTIGSSKRRYRGAMRRTDKLANSIYGSLLILFCAMIVIYGEDGFMRGV